MFVAHLPAGWLLSRRLARSRPALARIIPVGLIASVLPDLDLLWFYLVDHRRHLHHSYPTHWPLFWLIVAAAWFLAAWLLRSPRAFAIGALAFPNLLLHLGLDTVAGHLRWLAPFSQQGFSLFVVPARSGWWVANFLFHPSFLPEVAIVAWALATLWRARRASRAPAAAGTNQVDPRRTARASSAGG